MLSCVPQLQVLQLSENASHRPDLRTALAQSEHSLLNGFSEAWFLAVHTARGPGRGGTTKTEESSSAQKDGSHRARARERHIPAQEHARTHAHVCTHSDSE